MASRSSKQETAGMACKEEVVQQLMQVLGDVQDNTLIPIMKAFDQAVMDRVEAALLKSNSMLRDLTVLKSTLITLPLEIHRKIFELLDRTSSTCLGLCTKNFYSIHFSLRGTVPLEAWYSYPLSFEKGTRLYSRLMQWMEPKYEFDRHSLMFVIKRKPTVKNYLNSWQYHELRRKKRRCSEKRCLEAKLVDLKELGSYLDGTTWISIEDRENSDLEERYCQKSET